MKSIHKPVSNNDKLSDLYQFICSKLKGDVDYNKIRFKFNTKDITQYFFSNKDVSFLNSI